MGSAIRMQGQRSGAAGAAAKTLLALDAGSVFTKAALFGQVEGKHRLLAASHVHTTALPPQANLQQGVHAAVASLERIYGRALLHDGQVLTAAPEQPDGVDGVVLVTSAGGPLRLLTLGPGHQNLAALVQQALAGVFTVTEPIPAGLTPPRGRATPEWERWIVQSRAAPPHALLVVGNLTPGQHGRSDLAPTIRLITAYLDALLDVLPSGASDAAGADVLPVIFTGTTADATDLQNALRGRALVQRLEPLAPATLGKLNQTVGAIYESRVLRSIPGYETSRAQASAPPVSTATSLTGVVRYLGQRYQMNVIAADIGASSSALVGANARGAFVPYLLPSLGVGPGAEAVLRQAGATQIARWLTTPIGEEELRAYVAGRMLHPTVMPGSGRELEIEHALAREIILRAMLGPDSALAGLRPVDVILGTGGVFAHAPQPAQAALLLLDAFQPRGIASLVLDVAQITTMLGGLASLDPTIAGEVAEGDAVTARLGTVVSTFGATSYNQSAVRVVLEHSDGRRQVEDVMPGMLVRMPLEPGERGMLSLLPAPMVDIGLGPGQQARASEALEGGLLGLIIDTRGRPLPLPAEDERRQAKLREWRTALDITY